jgi:hypothetical protein
MSWGCPAKISDVPDVIRDIRSTTFIGCHEVREIASDVMTFVLP